MKRPLVMLGLVAVLGLGWVPSIRALEPEQEKELKKIQQMRLDAANLPGVLKENALKQALAQLEKLLATAKGAIEVRKEKLMILEGLELFGGKDGAFLGWDALMRQAKGNPDYFDYYYHLIHCLYQNSQQAPAAADRQRKLAQAASFIIKLENNQPNMGAGHLKKRYEELLQKEPLLKDAYLKGGGKELAK